MFTIELIGWMGAVLFSLCAFPQAYACYKTKHAKGLSWAFLGMWAVGELLTLIYAVVALSSWPLLFNYCFNLLCLFVILYYKVKGGKKDTTKLKIAAMNIEDAMEMLKQIEQRSSNTTNNTNETLH